MRSHLPAEAAVACILTRARGKTVDALFVVHRLAALLLQVYNIHLTAWEG
jgi:hypothetical protein